MNRYRAVGYCAAILLALCSGHVASAGDSLVIFPSSIVLDGPKSQQTLLVQEMRGEQVGAQVRDGIAFQSSDEKVVRVENGSAIPVGNGQATITAKVGNRTATVEVTVARQEAKADWTFRNHVQSVLSKAGCNSGACHGAAAGKNGFKLSLRGYDAKYDYFAITRQSGGRRIVPSDPGRSLFLTKPTGAIPHKGGIRFDVDSKEYRVLAEWLAAGHPGPSDADPRLERLEMLPSDVMLAPKATQQFVVLAHFSDGRVEDVTRWAKFTSTNLTVAKVDDFGKIDVLGNGVGAVGAWYLAHNVVGTVTVPYDVPPAADVYTKAERNNVIDDLVLDKLQRLNIRPSEPAGDSEFLRRAYLDTIGVLPTIDEARAFLSDPTPDKRARLVDQLLARPEFVDYWTYKWSDLLLINSERLRPKAVETYYGWVRKHVEDNTAWDAFVRELVTAKGSTLENGAANFYSLHEDPPEMAETVSMAFLGMSINCARCHDHPLEKWTNDDYYAMAGMFARVRGKGWGGDRGSGEGDRLIFANTEGELIQPRTGRAQQPRPLDGVPVSFDSTADRRIALAEWLTAPQNPYFTRAITNRVWANFFGVGIVEKVDDLRLTNPASNEKLLAALSDYLVASRYDLKALMRTILTSGTYQRSSRVQPGNEADERLYSRYYPKRLKAEALLDALSQVTGTPTTFAGYPAGTRALQLRDSKVASYFLNTFGRPERTLTCECERSNEPSMVQVLHIMNGDTINAKLEHEKSRVSQFVSAGAAPEQIVDDLYMSALARTPRSDEKAKILQVLAEAAADEKQRRLVIEDLYWSVLSSKEFLFNH
ncbi:MAG: DUF1549 and DUF1553 domain-containing protein [Planctomycetaceae bacterium]